MDPVAADGMLFYKGFFLVLSGIRSMVSSDDRWNEPFEMISDGDNALTWTGPTLALPSTCNVSGWLSPSGAIERTPRSGRFDGLERASV
ncbi:MAG: hypothetical protein GY939_24055 [Actinomycetia bacterium]|nr:hypothetical protein [Actinomycetes bacterium]